MRDTVKYELFRRGEIRWMLQPMQKAAFDFLDSHKSRHLVLHWHRGGGKSTCAVLRGTEVNLKRKISNVKYFGPTEKMVRKIAMPIMRQVLANCSKDNRPRWNREDSTYEWSNLSCMSLAAADGGYADSHRGTDTHLALLDEMGFMDDPDYLVEEVLIPRVIPVDGQFIHMSTSPRSPSHPFAVRVEQAKKDGNYIALRARDNPLVTHEMYRAFVEEAGGEDTTKFKREYECELVKDEEFAVVPGKFKTVEKQHVPVRLVTAGYIDFNLVTHFVIFEGTSDGGFVAVDELSVGNKEGITDTLSLLKRKELERGNLDVLRILIGPKIKELHPKLASTFELSSYVPDKYSPQSGTVLIRTMREGGALRVLEGSCPKTLRHLDDATWNEARTKFDNSGDGGNFEGVQAVAALATVFSGSSCDDIGGLAGIFGESRYDSCGNVLRRLVSQM